MSTSGVVKVSDFGIAHLVESQSDALKTLRANKTLQSDDEQHIGSPYWMAPEVRSERREGDVSVRRLMPLCRW